LPSRAALLLLLLLLLLLQLLVTRHLPRAAVGLQVAVGRARRASSAAEEVWLSLSLSLSLSLCVCVCKRVCVLCMDVAVVQWWHCVLTCVMVTQGAAMGAALRHAQETGAGKEQLEKMLAAGVGVSA
jgi:hypothetical protein